MRIFYCHNKSQSGERVIHSPDEDAIKLYANYCHIKYYSYSSFAVFQTLKLYTIKEILELLGRDYDPILGIHQSFSTVYQSLLLRNCFMFTTKYDANKYSQINETPCKFSIIQSDFFNTKGLYYQHSVETRSSQINHKEYFEKYFQDFDKYIVSTTDLTKTNPLWAREGYLHTFYFRKDIKSRMFKKDIKKQRRINTIKYARESSYEYTLEKLIEPINEHSFCKPSIRGQVIPNKSEKEIQKVLNDRFINMKALYKHGTYSYETISSSNTHTLGYRTTITLKKMKK